MIDVEVPLTEVILISKTERISTIILEYLGRWVIEPDWPLLRRYEIQDEMADGTLIAKEVNQ